MERTILYADTNPEDRLERVQRQLARLEQQKDKKALAKDTEYKKLSTEAKQLVTSIKALKKNRDSSPEDDSMCKYTNQFIPLSTSLPEDPEVKKIVDRTIKKANEANKKRIEQAGCRHQQSPCRIWQVHKNARNVIPTK